MLLRFLPVALLMGCWMPMLLAAPELRPEGEPGRSAPPGPPRARVVLTERSDLVKRFQPDDAAIRAAFNRLLLAYTGQPSPAQAWLTLVRPQDTVGIKISSTGGPLLGTHRALIEAVVDGLISAGVPPQQIIVWDKFEDQMINAGYVPMQPPSSWQCRAVIPGAGFDGERFYFHELAGQLIWGDRDFVGRAEKKEDVIQRLLRSAAENPDNKTTPTPSPAESTQTPTPPQVSNRSYFTRLLTRDITRLINMPVLSDHDRIGIWGAVASLALGSVDNHRRFLNNTEAAGRGIAEILENELIQSKTILHIMDGLVSQYAGGPSFHANYAESSGLIMISRDPVALDTLAMERIQDGRRARGLVPVLEPIYHLQEAAALGLGVTERSRMDLTVVP